CFPLLGGGKRNLVSFQWQKGNSCHSVKGQAVVFSPQNQSENLHRQVCPLDSVPDSMKMSESKSRRKEIGGQFDRR
ncbi:MAG: hypothetical protein K6B68_02825, partial [Eubacterium sp.]|nr:hypothetical protein [Eubacterium sp.]